MLVPYKAKKKCELAYYRIEFPYIDSYSALCKSYIGTF